MKLSNNRLYCFAFLLTIVLTACTPEQRKAWFEPAPKNTPKVQEAVFDNPDIIGTLGGRRVRMSFYQTQDVSFVGTPGPFSDDWATYKRPPRSYDNQIFDFSFYLNYKKGILRDIRNDDNFYKEAAKSGTPWILVGVASNNAIMNRPEHLDSFLQDDLEVKKELPSYTYVKIPEIQYGLERYIVPGNDPKTGKPYRFENSESDDLFIARDKNGHVRSYIKCFNKSDVPNPPCSHRFRVMDGIKVTLDMLYSRHLLHDWQKIEDEAAKIIYGFVRNAENDQAESTNQNRSKK